MPTLATEVFAIPIEPGKYIVYAPIRQTAFVANERTIEILAYLQNGAFDPDNDSDGSLLELLKQFNLIHTDTEEQQSNLSEGFQAWIPLTLVLEASEQDECFCCRPEAMGTEILMNLTTAKQAIDLAIEEANQHRISAIQITYHSEELTPTSQDLISASLNYAKGKALDFNLEVHTVIWTGDQLTHPQIDWIARNVDQAIIRFDKMPTVHNSSEVFDVATIYEPLLNTLHAFTSAGRLHAVRFTVTLGQIPSLVDAVNQICQNVNSPHLYIEPTYPLQVWQGQPSQTTLDFITAFRKAQQAAAIHKGRLTFFGAQLYRNTVDTSYCSAPLNSIIALPSGNILTADKRSTEKNDEYLFMATELMKDWLLAKIAASGGLIWRATEDKTADPGLLYNDENNPNLVQVALPQFALSRKSAKGANPTTGIFPVVAMPWEWRLSRRGFLGVCLSTTMALLLDQQRGTAFAKRVMPAEKSVAAVTSTNLYQIAATYVDPRQLSMTAIEVDDNDTISAGYHLRWFALQPIDNFFTYNPDDVERFLSTKRSDPDNPTSEDKPYNFGTPTWAYFIYRRIHYPHFDHQFEMTEKLVEQLYTEGQVLSDGIQIAFQPGQDEQTVVVKFQPQGDSRKRVVHFLSLKITLNSYGQPLPVNLAGYADEDPEPIRQIKLEWMGVSSNLWQAEAIFDQGHYDELRLIGKEVVPFTVSYSYMDEDTKLAQDPKNPGDGEWVRIRQIPFITQFSKWEDAKKEFFPQPPKNRYLDFSGANIREDDAFKLDFKYDPLFTELQKAFVRILYARNQGKEFLVDSGGRSLTEIKYNPYFFFELWSLDPIIATLYSQYYWDAPGLENPPTPGTTYDYMVTTAWQPPAQRLCYISQKVSQLTTPPVGSFTDLSGTQLEGVSRSNGEILYRAGLCWRIEPDDTLDYGLYEPPLADIRRGDSPDQMSLITHFVDSTATKPEERVVDTPIHVPQSIPYPINGEERQNFTPWQLAALDLMKTLQTRDGRAVITSAQVAAYQEMLRTPIDQFFAIQEPEQRFNEWLPVGPTGSRTLYYQVRPVDLFGRVGDWHGPVEVTLQANLPTPEAVGLRAMRNESGDLVISWRFGSRQLRSGTPVNHFNLLWKLYDPQDIGAQRRFILWQDQRLKSDIPFHAATTLRVTNVSSLNGSSISGQIIAVTASNTETVIAEETALFGPGKRVVTIITDQFFSGVLPFIDASERYSDSAPKGNDNGQLLDSLGLTVNGHEYDVIGLQTGEALHVSICVAADNREPADFFWSSLGSNKTFTLTFKSVKESLGFYQLLRRDSFPEIGRDPELSTSNLAITELAQRLAKRSTLQMRVLFPFNIEITGRESWLTSAIFEYGTTYLELQNNPGRVPILDLNTIEISSDALQFGKVWINSASPLTQELTIRNRGLADFLVRKVTSDSTAFSVEFPERGWVTISGKSELRMTVTFMPTALGDITAQLSIYGEGGDPLRIPLSGTGISVQESEEADAGPTMARRFLSELTLGQVIRDAEPDSVQLNPTPIFGEIILQDALGDSKGIYCRISLSSTYKVIASHTPTDGANPIEQLLDSRGGEFTFYDKESNQEVICEVLTRPNTGSPNNQSLSFLIRQVQFSPAPPIKLERDQDWTFYPVYREDIPFKELPEALKPGDAGKMINIAVSTHQHPAANGYDSEQEQNNLVSIPVQVQIPAEPPDAPSVAAPTLATPWVDPFKMAYTGLPKQLDNRKVVQYKLRLDDQELMNHQIPDIPANGAIEILRAPEDALRLQILASLRLPLPTDPQNDVGYQALGELTNDSALQEKLFDSSSDVRYGAGFRIFNQMNAAERYQAITSWLIRFWGDNRYSLQGAFQPIGKLDEPDKLYWIDELEGTASGALFYAIRTVRKGTAVSELKLLPFRVIVPNTNPPLAPTSLQAFIRDGKVVIQWLAIRDLSIKKFAIYRAGANQDTTTVLGMDKIATIDVVSDQEDPDKYYASLTVTRIRQRIQAVNEINETDKEIRTIRPWFALPNFHSIRGIYLAEQFNSQAIPMVDQIAENYFDETLTHYDVQAGRITGLSNLVVTNGNSLPLAIVYGVTKITPVVNPYPVIKGTVRLPRIRDLLGLYYSWQFDPKATTASDQSESNILDGTMKLVGPYITNIPVIEGERLSLVFRDVNEAITSIENLPVQEERLWLPFGPHVLDVIGLYRLTDVDRQDNLMQSGAIFDQLRSEITNVNLPNGASVLLEIQTEEQQWTDISEFNVIEIPASLQDSNISAILVTERISGELLPDQIPSEENMLPQNYTKIGNLLCFPPLLPHGINVTLISEAESAERLIVGATDKTFQYIDQGITPGEWRYRIVSIKENETGRMLHSAPSATVAVNMILE